MTVTINGREDFSFDNLQRVAWQGEPVAFSDSCMAHMAAARRSFMDLVESDTSQFIYGVTTDYGEGAKTILDAAGRQRMAKRRSWSRGSGIGEPFPDRVVRAMIFARLTNFVTGNAAISPSMAQKIADMLGGRPLPKIGMDGQDAAGESANLAGLYGHLLGDDCEEKDCNAIVNGSPCSAGLAGDTALRARNRLKLAEHVFALSIEAANAPLEHYDPALASLWGDSHDSAALHALNTLLAGAHTSERRAYQAPVSWRIIPRVLGLAHRAVVNLEDAALTAMRSVNDNPIYVLPDDEHPHGRVIHNGGFHNGSAYVAMNWTCEAWADLATLSGLHAAGLTKEEITGLNPRLRIGDSESGLGNGLRGAQRSVGRKARALAAPILLSNEGDDLQSDATVPTFDAYAKELKSAETLDTSLAMMALVASQALAVAERDPAPALRPFLSGVRALFPPVTAMRPVGAQVGTVADAFGKAALSGDFTFSA
jgi:histidine ammonia-lyase